MGDIPQNVYTSQNKKNFLFTMLFESVILLCFFGYFLCVTAAYSEDMHGPEEDAAAAPVEDKPASRAPSAQSKKSKQPSQKADEPAEGAEAPAEGAEGAGEGA